MSSRLRTFLGTVIVLALIAVPVVFAYHSESETRNFRIVRDGVLYRSGQMSLPGLKRIVHDYGIRTIVTLRDSYEAGKPPPDLAEENYCKSQGLSYVRITPRNWWGPDGIPPVNEGVRTFLQVMSDPHNQPVLVHCFAGIHRTGAYSAIFRMEFDGWQNERAIDEMKACGYYNVGEEEDILGYLERYRSGKLSEPSPQPTEKKRSGKKKASVGRAADRE